MTPRYVLDAWAVLAFLQKEEPAATEVRDLLRAGEAGAATILMSAISLGEVYYRVGRVRGRDRADATLASIRKLALTVLPAADALVLEAARLKMAHAISYVDAFAAAAATAQNATLVTGDRDFDRLHALLEIRWLQRGSSCA